MAAGCGERLTSDAWRGWPLRAARFPAEGKAEGLVLEHDTVYVWGGGKSEVTLHARSAAQVERLRFVRHAGMVDFMPRGTVLEEIQWRGQEFEYVGVCFEPEATERLLGRPAAFPADQLRTAVADPHVVDLVRRLRAEALSEQPLGTPYVEGLSLTLASYVYGKYERRVDKPESSPALAARDMQSLIAFVEDHLGQDITVTHLARLVGYGADHFSRLFKGSFGRSPYQYVVDRRVERAKLLLRKRTHSIAEIASLCGFGSQAHFHSAFKARTGSTPSAYRRE